MKCVQCGGSKTECKADLSDSPDYCPDETYVKCFTQIGK